jgi:hypothetical protein
MASASHHLWKAFIDAGSTDSPRRRTADHNRPRPDIGRTKSSYLRSAFEPHQRFQDSLPDRQDGRAALYQGLGKQQRNSSQRPTRQPRSVASGRSAGLCQLEVQGVPWPRSASSPRRSDRSHSGRAESDQEEATRCQRFSIGAQGAYESQTSSSRKRQRCANRPGIEPGRSRNHRINAVVYAARVHESRKIAAHASRVHHIHHATADCSSSAALTETIAMPNLSAIFTTSSWSRMIVLSHSMARTFAPHSYIVCRV